LLRSIDFQITLPFAQERVQQDEMLFGIADYSKHKCSFICCNSNTTTKGKTVGLQEEVEITQCVLKRV